MNLSVSSRSLCLYPVRRGFASAFVRPVLAVLLVASAVGWGQSLRPPASPEVAPVISEVYPDDADGDRISDALQQYTESAGRASSAGKRMGVNAVGEATVTVELVFNTPVSQEQIDAFLALGGEITYMYKAVSYGWKGRIAAGEIQALPAVMGPTLVRVEPAPQIEAYMDVAGQTGRVRPVWQPGFAGTVEGFDGDPNITIGFVVDGIDGTHPDLAGRCAYWSDLSGEGELNPVDYFGHGSMAAGIAVGTGQADALEAPALHYTYVGDWASDVHVVNPISFSSSTYLQVDSDATWVGAWSAALIQLRWVRGTYFNDLDWIGQFTIGGSDLQVSNTYMANHKQVFSVMLSSEDDRTMGQVVITNSLSQYPDVGDGYPRFRGVAPACRWALARVDTSEGWGPSEGLGESLDELVLHRETHNIKIINISHGLIEEGLPCESQSLRDKVNSAVRNGVVVVSAAGNSAYAPDEDYRKMADPPRAALAITVGASNDGNVLTYYSNYGFADPDHAAGEDHKPDLIAPGGSIHQSAITSVDSGCSDGYGTPDKQPDDYANEEGTSFASPFVAGCAALVIDAMQQQGIVWDFHSEEQPLFVKMLLCATASETNAKREDWQFNPSLQRGAEGPDAFPAGKDRYEGYGVINADAAVEAVCLTYNPNSEVSAELGPDATDRRVWARSVDLFAGSAIDISLDNPTSGDFDLYLYNAVPSDTGTPVILASSTGSGTGVDEALSYSPVSDATGLLVVKRVSGSGTFALRSEHSDQSAAWDISVGTGLNTPLTITLGAGDGESPNPPGALTYTIVSLPKHGQLERLDASQPIATVPTALEQGVAQVLYRPDPDWMGADSFTYSVDDGGTAPLGGRSNVATVEITVVQDITLTYQVAAPLDDAHAKRWSTYQKLNETALVVGQHRAGLRFGNVDIPQDARIVKANLKICSYTRDLTGQVDAVVYAEAADDVDEFSNSHRLSDVTRTNASQAWDWTTTWSSDTWQGSPDIAHVIQEVVDRPGWSANNAIVILCIAGNSTSCDRSFWSYDGDPDKAAQLEITYVP